MHRLQRLVMSDMDKEINPRFWGMLSISMKAGALAVGESRATESIRADEAGLIILSDDASGNTEKKFSDMGKYRNIPLIRVADRDSLGSAIGRKFAVVIAVNNEGFSKKLLELYENQSGKE